MGKQRPGLRPAPPGIAAERLVGRTGNVLS